VLWPKSNTGNLGKTAIGIVRPTVKRSEKGYITAGRKGSPWNEMQIRNRPKIKERKALIASIECIPKPT
jgi:hypothetical protein